MRKRRNLNYRPSQAQSYISINVAAHKVTAASSRRGFSPKDRKCPSNVCPLCRVIRSLVHVRGYRWSIVVPSFDSVSSAAARARATTRRRRGPGHAGAGGDELEARGRRTKVGRVERPAGGAFTTQTWQRLLALSCSTGATTPPAPSIYTVCVRVYVCVRGYDTDAGVCVRARISRICLRRSIEGETWPRIAARWMKAAANADARVSELVGSRVRGFRSRRDERKKVLRNETLRYGYVTA